MYVMFQTLSNEDPDSIDSKLWALQIKFKASGNDTKALLGIKKLKCVTSSENSVCRYPLDIFLPRHSSPSLNDILLLPEIYDAVGNWCSH